MLQMKKWEHKKHKTGGGKMPAACFTESFRSRYTLNLNSVTSPSFIT
jgi:hypothetical protein